MHRSAYAMNYKHDRRNLRIDSFDMNALKAPHKLDYVQGIVLKFIFLRINCYDMSI
jgi:hypothetical protein